MLYDYPKQTQFGRVIPKNKIYEHGSVNTAIKDKFVNQIEKIIWQYKLAPETLNLEATDNVPEIQVFDIYLKEIDIDEELLKVIDKAIPFPIFYQIHRANEVKIKAAYKRPSDADKNKWVVESYFESIWFDKSVSKEHLPVALNLEKLYEQMMKALMSKEVIEISTQSSMKETVDLIEKIKVKEKAYEKLKAKRDKEKQFNRKVELNKHLKELKQEIEFIRNGQR